MKIKITKHTEQEIEIGNKGDLILVGTRYHGKPSFRFGKLDGVVKRKTAGHCHEDEFVRFSGKSYMLNNGELMGVEVPRFFAYPGRKYLNTNLIESSVNGLESIIGHLDSTGNELYKGHADMLRRISKRYSPEGVK